MITLPRFCLAVAILWQTASVESVQTAQKVTPVEKVVALLRQLDGQITSDGKQEAAQYDKYACFCKEQADNKLYAIEQSQKKETKLTTTIESLSADILELSGQISSLGQKMTSLGHEIGNKTAKRQAEHDTYLANDKEVSDAIDACERAIAALQESKGALAGKVEMEAASLVQLRRVAVLGFGMAGASSGMTDSQWNTLSHLAKAGEPGEAYDYQYHANDILATLESLRLTFKKEKQDLYMAEFEAKTTFDKAVLDLENEKAFAQAERQQKEKVEALKTEQKEAHTEDLNGEIVAREADQSFMEVLKQDCATKAELFDKRSRTRSEELTAISKAMEALTTGVAPNWKANRKLIGLQTSKSALSFLQRKVVGPAAGKRIVELLKTSATRLSSSVLAMIALKVEASEDHFVKVRSMINDIIARLQAQAAAETTTKSWCDKQMKDAVTVRDQEQAKVEDLKARIAQNEADKAQLQSDIAHLSDSISKTQKALTEATELRADEKKDNTMVISQAGVGRDAVEYALQVLKDFYGPLAGFMQTGYVPPNSDRAGNTLGDLAPEYHAEDYNGKQESSKGIIGMLEVILADFDRTDNVVSGNERDAAEEFDQYKQRTNEDIDAMDSQRQRKNNEVEDINGELMQLTDGLKTATHNHKSALDQLSLLRSTCVEGEETYEERIAKRQNEIEALKEAHAILENWQA